MSLKPKSPNVVILPSSDEINQFIIPVQLYMRYEVYLCRNFATIVHLLSLYSIKLLTCIVTFTWNSFKKTNYIVV